MDKQDAIKILKDNIDENNSWLKWVKKQNERETTTMKKVREENKAFAVAIEALTDHKPTNRPEQIQQMDVEEMLNWLYDYSDDLCCCCDGCEKGKDCSDGVRRYLLKEVEDE